MNQEELKRFRECSLKARTLRIVLPSGFEFDFLLPTTGRFLELAKEEKITQDKIIQLLQEGFPEGLKVEDLPLTDFNYLQEVVGNFFEGIARKTIPQTGSKPMQES